MVFPYLAAFEFCLYSTRRLTRKIVHIPPHQMRRDGIRVIRNSEAELFLERGVDGIFSPSARLNKARSQRHITSSCGGYQV